MSKSVTQAMIKAFDEIREPVLFFNKFFDLSPIERDYK